MEAITISNTKGVEYSITVEENEGLYYASIATIAADGGVGKIIVAAEDNEGWDSEQRAFLSAVQEVLY